MNTVFSLLFVAFVQYQAFNAIINCFNNVSGDFLSFWGDICGGLIGAFATFLALYFTLKHQNKENRQNKTLEVTPYFNFKINKTIDKKEDYVSCLYLPHKSGTCNIYIQREFYLNIKNIGREAAFDFRLQHTNVKVNSKSMKNEIMFNHNYTQPCCLGRDETIDIKLGIPTDNIKVFAEHGIVHISFELIFDFYNILYDRFMQSVIIDLCVSGETEEGFKLNLKHIGKSMPCSSISEINDYTEL